MIHQVHPKLKRTHEMMCYVATDERLVIRPTVGAYVAYLVMLLITAAMPWWAWIFLIGGDFPTPIFVVFAPVLAFFSWAFVQCFLRWLTFDQRLDAVVYFPRKLCPLSKIRAVVVERRVRYSPRGTVWTYYYQHLELEGGVRVQLPAVFTSLDSRPFAEGSASIIANWLGVPLELQGFDPDSA